MDIGSEMMIHAQLLQFVISIAKVFLNNDLVRLYWLVGGHIDTRDEIPTFALDVLRKVILLDSESRYQRARGANLDTGVQILVDVRLSMFGN